MPGRFTPAVLPEYYPGAGEGLAAALGTIASSLVTRRRADREAASADSLKRMELIAQGFHPGTVPEVATAHDPSGRVVSPEDAEAYRQRVLAPDAVHQADASTDLNAMESRALGARGGLSGAPFDEVPRPAGPVFAEGATRRRTGEGMAFPVPVVPPPVASPAERTARRPTAGDSVANLGAARSPGATGSSPVTGKPMGAFDPTSLTFDYTPKAGAVDIGDVLLSGRRGATPEHWHYDPETSPEGRRAAAADAQLRARLAADAAQAEDRQRHEDARAAYHETAEDERLLTRERGDTERTRYREGTENARTQFRVTHEDARSDRDATLRAAEIDQRLTDQEMTAIAREAAELAAKPGGHFFGKLDAATDAVMQAHKVVRQRLAAERGAAQQAATPAGPGQLGLNAPITAQRQEIDREHQQVVSALRQKLASAVSELERQKIQADLDAVYEEWGAALKQAAPPPSAAAPTSSTRKRQ